MPTLYDNFERVRQYIDQHQGGGGDMSAYVTKDELSAQSYLTSIPSTYASYNGVYSYLKSIGITNTGFGGSNIDSAYITDSELSGDININGISTWELPTYAAISNMGYLTSIPSEYVTDTELSSALGNYYTDGEVDNEISSALSFYYTKTEINNASYVTSSDLPVINENIIPKENLTYQLGDSTHNYKATYTSSIKSNDSGITVQINNTNKYYISSSTIRPTTANSVDLGNSNYPFGATYTTNIYTENVSYTSGKSSIKMNDRNVDIWANNKKMVNVSDYNGVVPTQTNVNLGGSSNKWAATYTSVLYTNTAYLQDTSYSSSIVPKETGTYTLGDNSHFYDTTYTSKIEGPASGLGIRIGNANRYQFYNGAFRAADNNRNLGTSDYKWAATYTSNLYADNIHNFIWTGTSAEYAALSDYTTYQIYMIKEA